MKDPVDLNSDHFAVYRNNQQGNYYASKVPIDVHNVRGILWQNGPDIVHKLVSEHGKTKTCTQHALLLAYYTS